MSNTDILKIRYTVRTFDVDAMCYHKRIVYELLPGGKVTFFHYEKGIGKAIEKYSSTKATEQDYLQMCRRLNACIDTADGCNGYVDDTCGEVQLTRPFCRVDKLDRGYGSEDMDVGRIICEYIYNTAGMPW